MIVLLISSTLSCFAMKKRIGKKIKPCKKIKNKITLDEYQAFVEALIDDSDKALEWKTTKYKEFEFINCIDECREECYLNRRKYPGIRKTFENKLVKAISEQFDHHNQLHYTSFGSGHLFPDLAIIANLIETKGFKTCTINIIDTMYNSTNQEQLIKELITERLQQFATFFSFDSTNNIRVFAYQTALDYKQDIQRKYSTQPNVLVAIDAQVNFNSEHGIMLTTICDAWSLQKKTLAPGGIYASLSNEPNPLKKLFIDIKK